jgi:hypothetical protein
MQHIPVGNLSGIARSAHLAGLFRKMPKPNDLIFVIYRFRQNKAVVV